MFDVHYRALPAAVVIVGGGGGGGVLAVRRAVAHRAVQVATSAQHTEKPPSGFQVEREQDLSFIKVEP